MERLIIFLIRKRLGLKKNQPFQFIEQKELRDFYEFSDDKLLKFVHTEEQPRPANVSLNWLLNDECKVVVINI